MKNIVVSVLDVVGLVSCCQADLYTACSVGCDFADIQSAIDAASDNDEVVVGPGTYVGDGCNVVNMGGKQIVLRSEQGSEVTIIDG